MVKRPLSPSLFVIPDVFIQESIFHSVIPDICNQESLFHAVIPDVFIKNLSSTRPSPTSGIRNPFLRHPSSNPLCHSWRFLSAISLSPIIPEVCIQESFSHSVIPEVFIRNLAFSRHFRRLKSGIFFSVIPDICYRESHQAPKSLTNSQCSHFSSPQGEANVKEGCFVMIGFQKCRCFSEK